MVDSKNCLSLENPTQHTILMKKAIFTLGLFFFAAASFAQTVRGFVYEDKNGDGKAGSSEKGIASVVVSDGYNVVKTDASGRFEFESDAKGKFIYITTPSGRVHTTSFYHLKKKDAVYEFGLKAQTQKRSKFIHISDTEATIYKDWVDDLKDYITNDPVDFMVFNGDICYEKGLKFHRDNITDETMGTRMVYTVGNHDLMKTQGDYAEQLFEDCFGPVWYSFDVNGVHFVTLPVTYGDKQPRYEVADMYRWLRKDLEAQPKSKPVVVFCHFLLGHTDDFVLSTAEETLNLMDYNLKAWFYGHWHNNIRESSERTGVKTFSTMSPNKGGIDHSPSSFRVVSFDEQGNIENKLVYAKVRRHLAADAYRAGKEIKVTASAYDCTAGTDSMTLTVTEGGRERRIAMRQNSNWAWSVQIPVPASPYELKAKAYFANGDIVSKTVEKDRRIRYVANIGTNVLMASPVVAGKTVYVAGVDDENGQKCGIYAIDRSTGKLLWFAPTKNSVKNNIASDRGTVLACDAEGIVYAVDAENGKLKWSKTLEGALQPYYSQGICAENGVVYAGQGVSLAALDADTGEYVWKNTAWKGGVVSVPTNVIADGVLLTAAYWTGRFAHDAATGELLWQKRDDLTRNCDGSAAVYDGKFFYTSPTHIFEIDPRTGEELNSVAQPYTLLSVSKPLVTDSLFITGTADKGVVAFNRTDGYKQLWNFKTNPALFYTAPYTKDFQMTVESGCAMHNGNVYFGANDGYLYCVDARTGTFRWRQNIGSPVLSNIVIDRDELFLVDFAGNLFNIDISDR